MPAKHGAMVSLREPASGTEVEDYFQRTDLERYVKVLDAGVAKHLLAKPAKRLTGALAVSISLADLAAKISGVLG